MPATTIHALGSAIVEADVKKLKLLLADPKCRGFLAEKKKRISLYSDKLDTLIAYAINLSRWDCIEAIVSSYPMMTAEEATNASYDKALTEAVSSARLNVVKALLKSEFDKKVIFDALKLAFKYPINYAIVKSLVNYLRSHLIDLTAITVKKNSYGSDYHFIIDIAAESKDWSIINCIINASTQKDLKNDGYLQVLITALSEEKDKNTAICLLEKNVFSEHCYNLIVRVLNDSPYQMKLIQASSEKFLEFLHADKALDAEEKEKLGEIWIKSHLSKKIQVNQSTTDFLNQLLLSLAKKALAKNDLAHALICLKHVNNPEEIDSFWHNHAMALKASVQEYLEYTNSAISEEDKQNKIFKVMRLFLMLGRQAEGSKECEELYQVLLRLALNLDAQATIDEDDENTVAKLEQEYASKFKSASDQNDISYSDLKNYEILKEFCFKYRLNDLAYWQDQVSYGGGVVISNKDEKGTEISYRVPHTVANILEIVDNKQLKLEDKIKRVVKASKTNDKTSSYAFKLFSRKKTTVELREAGAKLSVATLKLQ